MAYSHLLFTYFSFDATIRNTITIELSIACKTWNEMLPLTKEENKTIVNKNFCHI